MSSSISVGVVAHVDRLASAANLAHVTQADYVSYDDGQLGCEANHRRVWAWHAEHPSDWAVVLEDDAIPVGGFCYELQKALDVAPAPIVSLYLGRLRPTLWQQRMSDAVDKAEANDASFIVGDHLHHAVGVAIRGPMVPHLLGHVTNLPADQHISVWARQRRYPVAYTAPSLVDHLDGPTLAHHPDGQPRTPGRRAWRFGTRSEWTSKTVKL